jgi:hypothetical protein
MISPRFICRIVKQRFFNKACVFKYMGNISVEIRENMAYNSNSMN